MDESITALGIGADGPAKDSQDLKQALAAQDAARKKRQLTDLQSAVEAAHLVPKREEPGA